MDLSNMSLRDLRELEQQVQTAIAVRRETDVAEARRQIETIAKSIGLSVQELVGGTQEKSGKFRKRAGSVPVRYRHPDNPDQNWTGRGRSPGWVKQWVDSGQPIDALRVVS